MATQTDPSPSVPGKKTLVERMKGSRFLVISILFHLVLFVVAGILVVQVITTKRKQTFSAVPPAPANRAVEHKVQMAKKQQSMSAPMTKRVVTTGLSKVALPEMPDIAAQPDLANPMVAAAAGAAPGLGVGTSMGTGTDGGSGGGLPFFGLRDNKGSAFEGTFYDFKQTRGRQPTKKLKEQDYRNMVGDFARRNMSEGFLNSYYRGKDKLYTSQFMMPQIPADEGPKAFGLEKEVKPAYWIVVYKAKVSPPHSGTVHFVGSGDDIMLIRFQGRLVLDGSLYEGGVTGWKPKTIYSYAPELRQSKFGNKPAIGWSRGEAVKVEAGQWYDMTVVVGEAPGGKFDASLFIEEEGATYEKDAKGNPVLPPFRVNNARLQFERGAKLPPFAKDGPIWKARSSSASGSSGSLLDGN